MILQRIQIVDSHTGGEPTRVIIAGGPYLGTASLRERLDCFRQEYDSFRRAVICEPRGSDVLVGAILCAPVDPTCVAGVIFFNNVGYLGMCGHGTIGVAVTLGHLGRIPAGRHRIETPVGIVSFDYDGRNTVLLENVPSYRLVANVKVKVDGVGEITGDVAWGGNWFFLVGEHNESLELANVARLTFVTEAIRRSLWAAGITAPEATEIDHVELFGPPRDPQNHSRNFVLCPGGAYDRSPCGTGTSAKVACLASDGKLLPGQGWRQESILGSVFEVSYRRAAGQILPCISGQAYITSEAMLLVDDADPLAWGLDK